MFGSNQSGKQKRLTSYFGGAGKENKAKAGQDSSRKRPRPNSGTSFRSQNGGSGFGVCPLCQLSFAWHVLENHASECTGIDSSNNKNSDERSTTKAAENTSCEEKVSPKGQTKSDGRDETIQNCSHMETPNAKTETVSNIVTPRLAPIFQAKTGESTKNHALHFEQHQQLRPHSYEPIPGLFVYEDFITEEEEALIVKSCINVDRGVLPAWKQSRFNGKNIGKRWGVHCNLRDRRVDAPENPLPDVLSKIVFPKLRRLNLPATKDFSPNEANAIDYRRREGHWLKAHVDDRKLSKEAIANLSLLGGCYMTFSNVSKHRNLAVTEQRVLLRRRCLQVLAGKARYDFSHGIANRDLLSDRRVSITMRESPLSRDRPTAHNQNYHTEQEMPAMV